MQVRVRCIANQVHSEGEGDVISRRVTFEPTDEILNSQVVVTLTDGWDVFVVPSVDADGNYVSDGDGVPGYYTLSVG